jgi:hypothetical protein
MEEGRSGAARLCTDRPRPSVSALGRSGARGTIDAVRAPFGKLNYAESWPPRETPSNTALTTYPRSNRSVASLARAVSASM